MIEINLYRSRIGLFNNTGGSISAKASKFNSCLKSRNIKCGIAIFSGILTLIGLVLLCSSSQDAGKYSLGSKQAGGQPWSSSTQSKLLFQKKGKHQTNNFQAKYLHGNIKRGIKNIHVNIRSIYNKMSEVKQLVKNEKPHILGISEAELRKRSHSLDKLKVPGYVLLLPKSWESIGKARLVVYVKKTIEYEQLLDIEHEEVQSIWIKAGFKNSSKIYFSHQYREHTNSMGSSMADQRTALKLQLAQWEDALEYGNPDLPNEVHVAGDMNLDSLKGRWLEPGYSLVTLARMVVDCCNANNFTQLVDKITRVQYNSIQQTTSVSCIDHLYCNAKHRISPVKIITFGASDHDAVSYTRYSKEPMPPPRTIRKRSYKKFKSEDYLNDVSQIDFTDVYCSLEVDDAADLLTKKLAHVLDKHAPWIVYQQRKHYAPWVTPETEKLMNERDELKEKAKEMASLEGKHASPEQSLLWERFKKLRNSINNKSGQEEVKYKKTKVDSCKDDPSMVWSLAKTYMNWKSPGPPSQLEVEIDKKLTLLTKAKDLAKTMNEFFISKVENIVNGLRKLPLNLSGCKKVMGGKNIHLFLQFVSVGKVRKLLGQLKNKKSTSIDQLDNFAVKIAADYLAGPLHHVISLSIMQQKFPSCWKLTKIVPLHKKNSTLKPENYRPVAILSPLSKVLEKAIYEQIYGYFSRNNLFDPALHGYRGGRSTMTALLTMYDKWVKAASKGQISGVVLVDLSAAFDLVSPDILVQKLRIYGLKEDIISWISSYLSDRYQSVWIDHIFSDLLPNSLGVPQGSNLGPLLFLIFFNDLPSFINQSIDCYADDSTLGATGKSVADIGEILSDDCKNLSDWMASNNFKLNAGKTHLLTMGTQRRLDGLTAQLEIVMDGINLEESEDKSEILLGIKIQNNLEWSGQVEELKGKLKKSLGGLANLKYIMGSSSKKNIVEGVFNSVLCYCLPLFGECNSSDIKALQVQQNKAAQIVLSMPPRSQRDNMYDRLNWLTVNQLVVYHTLLSVHRIRQSEEPEYLASILGKTNRHVRGGIIVENHKLGLARKSFTIRGAEQWNKLTTELRVETKLSKFKQGLRKWVAENVTRFLP